MAPRVDRGGNSNPRVRVTSWLPEGWEEVPAGGEEHGKKTKVLVVKKRFSLLSSEIATEGKAMRYEDRNSLRSICAAYSAHSKLDVEETRAMDKCKARRTVDAAYLLVPSSSLLAASQEDLCRNSPGVMLTFKNQVLFLHVNPRQRRMGYGSALVSAKKMSEQSLFVTLGPCVTNFEPFWERAGFGSDRSVSRGALRSFASPSGPKRKRSGGGIPASVLSVSMAWKRTRK